MTTYILSGPQGIGKTRNEARLVAALGITADDQLLLTNVEAAMPPGAVMFIVEDEAGLEALISLLEQQQRPSHGLLDGVCGFPSYIQSDDGRVINVVVSADEEHKFFVVGRFYRLADANIDGWNGRNLLKTDGLHGSHRCFRVTGQGHECFVRGGGQLCITPLDNANPAGSENMFAIEDGVVDQILPPLSDVRNEKALQHGLVSRSVVICEGPLTAASLFDAMREAYHPTA